MCRSDRTGSQACSPRQTVSRWWTEHNWLPWQLRFRRRRPQHPTEAARVLILSGGLPTTDCRSLVQNRGQTVVSGFFRFAHGIQTTLTEAPISSNFETVRCKLAAFMIAARARTGTLYGTSMNRAGGSNEHRNRILPTLRKRFGQKENCSSKPPQK